MIYTATKLIALTAFALGSSFFVLTHSPHTQDQDEQVEEDTTPFMLRKLTYSRDIVSGLALEDFELISKRAQDLMLLSHEADWKVLTTPEYLKMSSDFRGSAERLRNNANEKNLDGATLSYFEVTLNCVRCHKYIRKDVKDNN